MELPQDGEIKPESMELVQARTWELLGECKVKLNWEVWDEKNQRWRTVDKLSRVLKHLTPAGAHLLNWEFLTWLNDKRREIVVGKETESVNS